MGKIINFPFQARPKFELKKARKRRKDPGQLDLFAEKNPAQANVRSIHGVFEEALLHDNLSGKDTEELYLKAIEEGDSVADAYCNLGILEYNKGNKAKAIQHLTSALKEDPAHFESHYNIGNLYFDVENYELATFHYEVAIEMQADYPPIYFNLALARASANRINEAISALKDYLKLEDSAEANELLGNFIKLSANS